MNKKLVVFQVPEILVKPMPVPVGNVVGTIVLQKPMFVHKDGKGLYVEVAADKQDAIMDCIARRLAAIETPQ